MPQAEQTLLQFLAAELAPTPGRARATGRIVAACVVAALIGYGFHVPEVHWALVTIFTVSQPDAGASLVKGQQRVLATFLGGVAGILLVTIFADEPWIRVPLLGAIAALGIFLSRTTTAPYVGLLGAFTALLIGTVARGTDPSAAIAVGLWRILLICGGVILGTGAQVFLWPVDPEATLLGLLRARVAAAARSVRRVLAGAPPADDTEAQALARDGLLRQLDLLSSAEARHPSLRRRHLEQLALIGGAERLLTAALALDAASAGALGDAGRRRLERIAAECDRLEEALRQPVDLAAADLTERPPDAAVAAAGGTALLPGFLEMEGALAQLAVALGAQAPDRSVGSGPTLLDAPRSSGYLTPAFSAANTAELAFAFKAGLAATICEILVNGFAWPGVDTAIWTSILVAQSSVGAVVQKSLLRLAGAILGGLLGLAAIAVVMTNGQTLASMLLIVAAGATVAAWLSTGSARIAYAGFQTGLAFALCIDAVGPVTNLTVGRDRVLGILLGILVTGAVFAAFGHTLARDGLRGALARALRALAAMARVGTVAADPRLALEPRQWLRWDIYRSLADALRLREESGYEAGASAPEVVALRAGVLRATDHALAAMLALLAVVRHRLAADLHASAETHARLQALATAIAASFEGLADQLDGRPPAPLPDLDALLARAEAADAGPAATPHLRARIALYRALVGAMHPLARDATALALDGTSHLAPASPAMLQR